MTPTLKVLSVKLETGKIPRDITVADIRDFRIFYRIDSPPMAMAIAIIDAADDMNANAANSLLKI